MGNKQTGSYDHREAKMLAARRIDRLHAHVAVYGLAPVFKSATQPCFGKIFGKRPKAGCCLKDHDTSRMCVYCAMWFDCDLDHVVSLRRLAGKSVRVVGITWCSYNWDERAKAAAKKAARAQGLRLVVRKTKDSWHVDGATEVIVYLPE